VEGESAPDRPVPRRLALGNGIGKRIATTYYRYTLYTAEPIRELYSMDGSRAAGRNRSRAAPIRR
jgi:hypothetical protein